MNEAALLGLAEREDDLVPEILPATPTLSIRAEGSTLRALFSRASGVTPQREVVPGTAHALLEAFPSSSGQSAYIKVTASDGEQTVMMVEDQVKVRVSGAVLLPPKRVLDILRLAPEDLVDITVVGETAVIRSGRAQWSVAAPVGRISDLSSLVDTSHIQMRPVPAQGFLRGLQHARKAASSSNARAALMQMLVKDSAVLSCDGGRLHQCRVEGLDPTIDTTIPIKVADELIKALEAEQSLLMGYDDRALVFQIGQDFIVAQRLLLPFPDVQSLLLSPKVTNNKPLVIDRVELDNAIRRVRINADPDIAVVTLSTVQGARSGDDWSLLVQSRDRAGNAAQESVSCQWEGSSASVAYNHHHLIDLLGCCSSEMLVLLLGPDTKTMKTPLLVEDPAAGMLAIIQQVTQRFV